MKNYFYKKLANLIYRLRAVASVPAVPTLSSTPRLDGHSGRRLRIKLLDVRN